MASKLSLLAIVLIFGAIAIQAAGLEVDVSSSNGRTTTEMATSYGATVNDFVVHEIELTPQNGGISNHQYGTGGFTKSVSSTDISGNVSESYVSIEASNASSPTTEYWTELSADAGTGLTQEWLTIRNARSILAWSKAFSPDENNLAQSSVSINPSIESPATLASLDYWSSAFIDSSGGLHSEQQAYSGRSLKDDDGTGDVPPPLANGASGDRVIFTETSYNGLGDYATSRLDAKDSNIPYYIGGADTAGNAQTEFWSQSIAGVTNPAIGSISAYSQALGDYVLSSGAYSKRAKSGVFLTSSIGQMASLDYYTKATSTDGEQKTEQYSYKGASANPSPSSIISSGASGNITTFYESASNFANDTANSSLKVESPTQLNYVGWAQATDDNASVTIYPNGMWDPMNPYNPISILSNKSIILSLSASRRDALTSNIFSVNANININGLREFLADPSGNCLGHAIAQANAPVSASINVAAGSQGTISGGVYANYTNTVSGATKVNKSATSNFSIDAGNQMASLNYSANANADISKAHTDQEGNYIRARNLTFIQYSYNIDNYMARSYLSAATDNLSPVSQFCYEGMADITGNNSSVMINPDGWANPIYANKSIILSLSASRPLLDRSSAIVPGSVLASSANISISGEGGYLSNPSYNAMGQANARAGAPVTASINVAAGSYGTIKGGSYAKYTNTVSGVTNVNKSATSNFSSDSGNQLTSLNYNANARVNLSRARTDQKGNNIHARNLTFIEYSYNIDNYKARSYLSAATDNFSPLSQFSYEGIAEVSVNNSSVIINPNGWMSPIYANKSIILSLSASRPLLDKSSAIVPGSVLSSSTNISINGLGGYLSGYSSNAMGLAIARAGSPVTASINLSAGSFGTIKGGSYAKYTNTVSGITKVNKSATSNFSIDSGNSYARVDYSANAKVNLSKAHTDQKGNSIHAKNLTFIEYSYNTDNYSARSYLSAATARYSPSSNFCYEGTADVTGNNSSVIINPNGWINSINANKSIILSLSASRPLLDKSSAIVPGSMLSSSTNISINGLGGYLSGYSSNAMGLAIARAGSPVTASINVSAGSFGTIKGGSYAKYTNTVSGITKVNKSATSNFSIDSGNQFIGLDYSAIAKVNQSKAHTDQRSNYVQARNLTFIEYSFNVDNYMARSYLNAATDNSSQISQFRYQGIAEASGNNSSVIVNPNGWMNPIYANKSIVLSLSASRPLLNKSSAIVPGSVLSSGASISINGVGGYLSDQTGNAMGLAIARAGAPVAASINVSAGSFGTIKGGSYAKYTSTVSGVAKVNKSATSNFSIDSGDQFAGLDYSANAKVNQSKAHSDQKSSLIHTKNLTFIEYSYNIDNYMARSYLSAATDQYSPSSDFGYQGIAEVSGNNSSVIINPNGWANRINSNKSVVLSLSASRPLLDRSSAIVPGSVLSSSANISVNGPGGFWVNPSSSAMGQAIARAGAPVTASINVVGISQGTIMGGSSAKYTNTLSGVVRVNKSAASNFSIDSGDSYVYSVYSANASVDQFKAHTDQKNSYVHAKNLTFIEYSYNIDNYKARSYLNAATTEYSPSSGFDYQGMAEVSSNNSSVAINPNGRMSPIVADKSIILSLSASRPALDGSSALIPGSIVSANANISINGPGGFLMNPSDNPMGKANAKVGAPVNASINVEAESQGTITGGAYAKYTNTESGIVKVNKSSTSNFSIDSGNSYVYVDYGANASVDRFKAHTDQNGNNIHAKNLTFIENSYNIDNYSARSYLSAATNRSSLSSQFSYEGMAYVSNNSSSVVINPNGQMGFILADRSIVLSLSASRPSPDKSSVFASAANISINGLSSYLWDPMSSAMGQAFARAGSPVTASINVAAGSYGTVAGGSYAKYTTIGSGATKINKSSISNFSIDSGNQYTSLDYSANAIVNRLKAHTDQKSNYIEAKNLTFIEYSYNIDNYRASSYLKAATTQYAPRSRFSYEGITEVSGNNSSVLINPNGQMNQIIADKSIILSLSASRPSLDKSSIFASAANISIIGLGGYLANPSNNAMGQAIAQDSGPVSALINVAAGSYGTIAGGSYAKYTSTVSGVAKVNKSSISNFSIDSGNQFVSLDYSANASADKFKAHTDQKSNYIHAKNLTFIENSYNIDNYKASSYLSAANSQYAWPSEFSYEGITEVSGNNSSVIINPNGQMNPISADKSIILSVGASRPVGSSSTLSSGANISIIGLYANLLGLSNSPMGQASAQEGAPTTASINVNAGSQGTIKGGSYAKYTTVASGINRVNKSATSNFSIDAGDYYTSLDYSANASVSPSSAQTQQSSDYVQAKNLTFIENSYNKDNYRAGSYLSAATGYSSPSSLFYYYGGAGVTSNSSWAFINPNGMGNLIDGSVPMIYADKSIILSLSASRPSGASSTLSSGANITINGLYGYLADQSTNPMGKAGGQEGAPTTASINVNAGSQGTIKGGSYAIYSNTVSGSTRINKSAASNFSIDSGDYFAALDYSANGSVSPLDAQTQQNSDYVQAKNLTFIENSYNSDNYTARSYLSAATNKYSSISRFSYEGMADVSGNSASVIINPNGWINSLNPDFMPIIYADKSIILSLSASMPSLDKSSIFAASANISINGSGGFLSDPSSSAMGQAIASAGAPIAASINVAARSDKTIKGGGYAKYTNIKSGAALVNKSATSNFSIDAGDSYVYLDYSANASVNRSSAHTGQKSNYVHAKNLTFNENSYNSDNYRASSYLSAAGTRYTYPSEFSYEGTAYVSSNNSSVLINPNGWINPLEGKGYSPIIYADKSIILSLSASRPSLDKSSFFAASANISINGLGGYLVNPSNKAMGRAIARDNGPVSASINAAGGSLGNITGGSYARYTTTDSGAAKVNKSATSSFTIDSGNQYARLDYSANASVDRFKAHTDQKSNNIEANNLTFIENSYNIDNYRTSSYLSAVASQYAPISEFSYQGITDVSGNNSSVIINPNGWEGPIFSDKSIVLSLSASRPSLDKSSLFASNANISINGLSGYLSAQSSNAMGQAIARSGAQTIAGINVLAGSQGTIAGGSYAKYTNTVSGVTKVNKSATSNFSIDSGDSSVLLDYSSNARVDRFSAHTDQKSNYVRAKNLTFVENSYNIDNYRANSYLSAATNKHSQSSEFSYQGITDVTSNNSSVLISPNGWVNTLDPYSSEMPVIYADKSIILSLSASRPVPIMGPTSMVSAITNISINGLGGSLSNPSGNAVGQAIARSGAQTISGINVVAESRGTIIGGSYAKYTNSASNINTVSGAGGTSTASGAAKVNKSATSNFSIDSGDQYVHLDYSSNAKVDRFSAHTDQKSNYIHAKNLTFSENSYNIDNYKASSILKAATNKYSPSSDFSYQGITDVSSSNSSVVINPSGWTNILDATGDLPVINADKSIVLSLSASRPSIDKSSIFASSANISINGLGGYLRDSSNSAMGKAIARNNGPVSASINVDAGSMGTITGGSYAKYTTTSSGVTKANKSAISNFTIDPSDSNVILDYSANANVGVLKAHTDQKSNYVLAKNLTFSENSYNINNYKASSSLKAATGYSSPSSEFSYEGITDVSNNNSSVEINPNGWMEPLDATGNLPIINADKSIILSLRASRPAMGKSSILASGASINISGLGGYLTGSSDSAMGQAIARDNGPVTASISGYAESLGTITGGSYAKYINTVSGVAKVDKSATSTFSIDAGDSNAILDYSANANVDLLKAHADQNSNYVFAKNLTFSENSNNINDYSASSYLRADTNYSSPSSEFSYQGINDVTSNNASVVINPNGWMNPLDTGSMPTINADNSIVLSLTASKPVTGKSSVLTSGASININGEGGYLTDPSSGLMGQAIARDNAPVVASINVAAGSQGVISGGSYAKYTTIRYKNTKVNKDATSSVSVDGGNLDYHADAKSGLTKAHTDQMGSGISANQFTFTESSLNNRNYRPSSCVNIVASPTLDQFQYIGWADVINTNRWTFDYWGKLFFTNRSITFDGTNLIAKFHNPYYSFSRQIF